jgi:hypothetical protein
MRCTALCDKSCQWLATGRWFSLGPPVSSPNKIDRHECFTVANMTWWTVKEKYLYHKWSWIWSVCRLLACLMVLNATFNNTSVISCRSILLNSGIRHVTLVTIPVISLEWGKERTRLWLRQTMGRRGRDHMVVGFTTTYATSAYYLLLQVTDNFYRIMLYTSSLIEFQTHKIRGNMHWLHR